MLTWQVVSVECLLMANRYSADKQLDKPITKTIANAITKAIAKAITKLTLHRVRLFDRLDIVRNVKREFPLRTIR